MAKEIKRLYRSRKESMIGGVCGGIAEYFEIDPTIIRFAFIILTVITGFAPGMIAYFTAMVIIPEKKN